jgi:ABC-type branched-subunit amino acid transport system substrate-binding protein
MRKTRWTILIMAVCSGLLAAACSSSSTGGPKTSGTTAGTTAGATTKTVTIGVLTDLTGEAASGNKTTPEGIKAGVFYAKDHGFNIKYVVADTQTSPASALSAAQELVEQDHVVCVIAISSLTFAASSFLTKSDVPVIGAAEDASEWVASANMFPVTGRLDAAVVATTAGKFFKLEGVTSLGVLGYSISPQSADAAEGDAVSAQSAGLKAGYTNASFQFGSTNVQPIALAMKSAGVNGVTATVDPNTGLLLVTALKQSGADIKVALLPTGYGGDIEQAGSNALSLAQNVYFLSQLEPVEMHTAATEEFQKYLSDAGVSGDPTYAEYEAYASMTLLVQALEAVAGTPTQANVLAALSKITDFNAAGLFGNQSIDFTSHTPESIGPGECEYVTKLSGSAFKLVPGADPICGALIPGKTVSPPS